MSYLEKLGIGYDKLPNQINTFVEARCFLEDLGLNVYQEHPEYIIENAQLLLIKEKSYRDTMNKLFCLATSFHSEDSSVSKMLRQTLEKELDIPWNEIERRLG